MYSDMAISLVEAIQNGDEKRAKMLLQQRAYRNIDHQGSRKDGTALFWSCCKGYIELVHLLILHGATVDRTTSWGASPLHASADNNHIHIVDLLIRFGADVNKQTNSGDTPCHLAAYRGYSACVQKLAEEGADIEINNNKRHRPIEEALSRGHYHTYQYLLAVQQIVRKCKSGQSTTHTERRPRNIQVFQTLKQCDAQTTPLQTDGSTTCVTSVPRGARMCPEHGHAVGVLRIRNTLPASSDYSISSTSGTDTDGFSSLNDLSSVTSDCSGFRTISNSQMSFKNIQ